MEKFDLTKLAKNETPEGFDVDKSAMSNAWIKLVQQLSPEINQKKEEYVEGSSVGDFINSVTRENLGNSFKAVVVGFERVYVEWKPNRGGLVGYHTPEEAETITVTKEFNKWATPAGNTLVETYLYKLIISGKESDGIVVASLTSSNVAEAKKWYRQLFSTKLADGSTSPPHYITWEISSFYKENDKGGFYVWKVKKDGFIDEKQFSVVSDARKYIIENDTRPKLIENAEDGQPSISY